MLLWIVIIVVIAGAGYLLLNNSSAAPSSDGVTGESSDVVMEGDMTDISSDTAGMETETMDDDSMMTKEPIVISYTDESFSPNSVTVKKGQTVRFVNNSSQDTWPASAVHPTHSVYPEKTEGDCFGSAFDACKRLKPGESWEFTFNEVGEWRYHDHVHASKTGVVVVE